MKNFFVKKKQSKVSVPPCSTDQVGCYYHIELFGRPCPGCTHIAQEELKSSESKLPKSSPLHKFLKS